jgi:centrosomal CEP192-like protein
MAWFPGGIQSRPSHARKVPLQKTHGDPSGPSVRRWTASTSCLLLILSACFVWVTPTSSQSTSSMTVWGRDTWLAAGSSRVIRVVSTVDLVFSGDIPAISFSPGPITVNYVLVTNPRDLTISMTVPPTTPPGFQTLIVSDGTLINQLADALRIVDATIPNPSPSVMPLGGSSKLSVAPSPLFQGQTSFTADMGSDISVGSISLQPDGSLQVPVSVPYTAIPGTRSVHLTSGPYGFVADRGFAVSAGPPVNTISLTTPTGSVTTLNLLLPAGYTASVFAYASDKSGGAPDNGLLLPDEMYVDENDSVYVLNQMGTTAPSTVSIFGLSPANFGAFQGLLEPVDPSGTDHGLLESATKLPDRPGTLFVSLKDSPPTNLGGRTIYALDTAVNTSSLFYSNSGWNLDAMTTDVEGNLAFFHTIDSTGQAAVGVLSPSASLLNSCNVNPASISGDLLRLDPLSGNFVMDNSVSGSSTLNISNCSFTPRSDGPLFDEGSFALAGGNFGNEFYIASPSQQGIFTLIPVSYTDPNQTVPERALVFAQGFSAPDAVWFDRDGQNLLVTDNRAMAVIAVARIAGYHPPAPVVQLTPTSLTFPTTVVGSSSGTQSVTLSNTGSANLTIAQLATTGDFVSNSANCTAVMAPGASCTLNVYFAPTATGSRTGVLTVTDNAPGSPQTVTLSGTGTQPAINLTPGSLTFPSTLVGSSSGTQSVTLSNTGSANLTIAQFAISGDFVWGSANCTAVMAPGASCTLNVYFAPTATGSRTGALTITDNAPGSPQTVTLSGTGT